MVKSSELCAVTKSQELKQHFWHTFVSTNFVHNHWLGQVIDGPHSDTGAPFPESFWTRREHNRAEHARFQRAQAYTPLFFSTHSLVFGASDDLSYGCSQGQPLSREYSWGGSWSYLELVLLCNFMRTSTIPDAFVSGGESSRDSILNALIYIQ